MTGEERTLERTATAHDRLRPVGGAVPSASPGPLSTPGRGRRPYRRPRLESHGRLAEVTRFGGSQVLDSGGGLGQAI